MVPRRRAASTIALTALLGLAALSAPPPGAPAAVGEKPARPRLVVVVLFDQLRGDYLTRWDKLFDDGGFHRLEADGAWFQNCHYPYAHTVTAAGHATVATGALPRKHGVVGNEWYDRASGKVLNCMASDRYQQVPPRARAAKKDDKKGYGVSPESLLSPTLADALKEATEGKGRVVSLSLKDRSAVLPGGRRPDACYWLDSDTGLFVTSTYYRDRAHPWVEDYNRGRPADRWSGRKWRRLLPDLDYQKHSGPDDERGEGTGYLQGRTFPHPFDAPWKPKSVYYGAVMNSPFGNDLLLDLARRAIDAEHLGGRDTPDLLCLSFSSNDLIGHVWGPDSQEVLDVTLRSDRVVKQLLDLLDEEVGRGRYALALTADHGICPLPEVARKQGKDAGRVSPALLRKQAEEYLDRAFSAEGGQTPWIEAVEAPWIYLNRAALRRRGLKSGEVEAALARWLDKQPWVEKAYTRSGLLAGEPKGDARGRAVWRSFREDRCGDVVVVNRPYYLITSTLTGTNHGTPHEYDTHVPLLLYGPGVRKGVRRERVSPQAAAVSLARLLGIKPPADADVAVPDGLVETTR